MRRHDWSKQPLARPIAHLPEEMGLDGFERETCARCGMNRMRMAALPTWVYRVGDEAVHQEPLCHPGGLRVVS